MEIQVRRGTRPVTHTQTVNQTGAWAHQREREREKETDREGKRERETQQDRETEHWLVGGEMKGRESVRGR